MGIKPFSFIKFFPFIFLIVFYNYFYLAPSVLDKRQVRNGSCLVTLHSWLMTTNSKLMEASHLYLMQNSQKFENFSISKEKISVIPYRYAFCQFHPGPPSPTPTTNNCGSFREERSLPPEGRAQLLVEEYFQVS